MLPDPTHPAAAWPADEPPSSFGVIRLGARVRVDIYFALWVLAVALMWLSTLFQPAPRARLLLILGFNIGMVLGIILHEIAHAIIATGRGYRINHAWLYFAGSGIDWSRENEDAAWNDVAAVALAGPIANLVATTVLVLEVSSNRSALLAGAALANTWLGIGNLIPRLVRGGRTPGAGPKNVPSDGLLFSIARRAQRNR